MSSFIKSFIRVRPTAVGGDLASGSCLTVGSNKAVTIKRPNEKPHEVDEVFADIVSNEGVWSSCGQAAFNAAMTSHAVVSVYGETSSGKSFTAEGLAERVIESLGGNSDANMTIVAIRGDNVIDLVKPALDNLKLKVDDTGVSAEGATTVKIPSTAAGMEHVKACIAARDNIIASNKLPSHFLTTVYSFFTGSGTLTIIDCSGSDRVLHVGYGPEVVAENKARLKGLQALTRCWMDAAVNADPKALAFKDSKVARFLTAGLSAAMDGKGYAAQIITVRNVEEALFETMCNVSYAEACVKQEGLKSVSEYKEKIEFMEERRDLAEKEKIRLQAELKAAEQQALKAKMDIDEKLKSLQDQKADLAGKVNVARATCAQEMERFKKTLEQEKIAHQKKQQEEIERMRNMATNAPAQAEIEIKKKTEEMNAAHKAKIAAMNAEIEQLKAEIKENKELLDDLEAMKKEREKEEQIAMKPVREMEKELSKINAQLATAGKSREDGLTNEEIIANQRLWEARDELDDVDEDVNKLALECMMLEHGLNNKIGEPQSSKDSSDSDSDSDSDSSDSDSDSSDSDSDSETEEEKAEKAKKMAEEMARQKQEEQERHDKVAFEKEFVYFRESLKKEQFLQELVDKIVAYLEYGTNVTMLTEKGFSRHFIFVTKNRKTIGVIPEVAEGVVPQKKTVQRAFEMENTASLVLGQHSKVFQSWLKQVQGRVDPPRTEAPPTAEHLTHNNMHRYYYRSFSLISKDGDSLDLVADTQTDFEALVVALHRLTRQDALWGKKLYIDFCDQVDDLKPFEKRFCEESHLTPQQYLSAKEKILLNDELLFITLHDIRLMTSMDLYHAQRLLELFMNQKWVVRRQLNYFKYQEKLEKSAGMAANRLGGAFKDPAAGVADDLI